MSLRTIYYQGKDTKAFHLVESAQLFILRVKRGYSPSMVFNQATGMSPFIDRIEEKAQFVDSRAYVYKFNGSSNHRDEVKTLIRSSCQHMIEYVGTLLEFSNSHIYQIYTGNLFIKFKDELALTEQKKFLKKYNLEVKRKLKNGIAGYFCSPKEDQHKEIFQYCINLLDKREVQFCHPELVTELRPSKGFENELPIEESTLPRDWWLRKVQAFEAWKTTKGKDITIAIIDDGIEANHPAFRGKFVCPRDMRDEEGSKFPLHTGNQGHGTACASIASSSDPFSYGVAPESKIMPIRITGLGSVLQAEAIYWAVDNGADVISCSWGPPDGRIDDDADNNSLFPLPDHTRLAFEYAVKKGRNGRGCSIFFAAGNGKEYFSKDGYASAKEVMAISSINYQNIPTSYADYGNPLLCVFPSGDAIKIANTGKYDYTGIFVADRIGEKGYDPTDYYALFTGTSASCPGVAGIAALMYSINPNLTRDDIEKIITQSCEKLGGIESYTNNYNQYYGNGMLNALQAVQNTKIYNPINSQQMNNANKKISLHIGINNVDQSYYDNLVPPLTGCINDMKNLGQLASQAGFETNFLQNASATRSHITSKIIELGNAVEQEGMFLITYAGHGVQMEDQSPLGDNDNEIDGKDESWVVYDGFYLDDEIFNALAQIDKDIRVLLISDSCHSEQMSRIFRMGEEVNERMISPETAKRVLEKNGQSIRGLYEDVGGKIEDYKVRVLNFSACKADQTAKEINGNGVFTSSLVSIYDKKTPNSYQSWIDQVTNDVSSQNLSQTPNYTSSHVEDPQFIQDDIFSNTKQSKTVKSEQSINTNNKRKQAPRLYDLGDINIIKNDKVERGFINAIVNRNNNQSPWDNAYSHVLSSDKPQYTEPNLLSNLYYDGELEDDQNERTVGDILETYPHPDKLGTTNYSKDVPNFIWHLSENYSQLRKANEEVFPFGPDTPSKVRIAHIDTGIIEDHPTKPMRYLTNLERSFRLSGDYNEAQDIDKKFNVEQQGHGHGTISILAGNKVTYEDTSNEYSGYFGAAPFVEIFSIRISDTVVLLSGNNFLKAVEHAIASGADVITMSMAGLPGSAMAEAVNKAYEAGVVLVSAAGNNWTKGFGRLAPKKLLYPARYDRVIAATGATYYRIPYLNSDENEQIRAAGGKNMQSCFGPENVMGTAIAAYTPNLPWFDKNERLSNGKLDYKKTGGGTSSATPQIAAAAALYIQKYYDELKEIGKKTPWKKAEIVRQALFQSAESNVGWEPKYEGAGLLKASRALREEYSPSNIKNINKADAANQKYSGLFKRVISIFRRDLTQVEMTKNHADTLNQMFTQELNQLLLLDPELSKYQYLDFDHIDYTPDSLVPILKDVKKSTYASDFLKRQITDYLSNDSQYEDDYKTNRILSSRSIITVRSQAKNFAIQSHFSDKIGFGDSAIYIDEFELDIDKNRSTRSDLQAEIFLELEAREDKAIDSAMLLEKTDGNGTVFEWQFSKIPKQQRENRSLREEDVKSNQYIIFNSQNTRGFINGGKIKMKIFSWIKKKILSSSIKKFISGQKKGENKMIQALGEKRYAIQIFDLQQEHIVSNSGWEDIENMQENGIDKKSIYKALSEDKKPVLVVFPGLFSKVEKGFEEFLSYDHVRSDLLKKYCRYIIGVNIPTVFHGIELNAERVNELLEDHLDKKECVVLARSRGSILARYLFEKTWIDNRDLKPIEKAPLVLSKMIMTGPPNQGTMIANSENWESLFNLATNVAKFTSLLGSSILPTIVSVIKSIGLGVVDLPGINDLDEGSNVLIELNQNTKANRDHYYVVISDYEPNQRWFRRLLDEKIIDAKIFLNEANDSIVHYRGAFMRHPRYEASFTIPKDKILIASNQTVVNHFNYLDPGRNPDLVKRILKVLE